MGEDTKAIKAGMALWGEVLARVRAVPCVVIGVAEDGAVHWMAPPLDVLPLVEVEALLEEVLSEVRRRTPSARN